MIARDASMPWECILSYLIKASLKSYSQKWRGPCILPGNTRKVLVSLKWVNQDNCHRKKKIKIIANVKWTAKRVTFLAHEQKQQLFLVDEQNQRQYILWTLGHLAKGNVYAQVMIFWLTSLIDYHEMPHRAWNVYSLIYQRAEKYRDMGKTIKRKMEKREGKCNLHASLHRCSHLNWYCTLLIHHPWPTPMHSHPSPAILKTLKK